MVKTLSTLGIHRNSLNLIKTTYKKLTDNIILNGVRLEALPLISGMWQECPLSPFLFNTVLGVLANAVRQEKKIRDMHIGKNNLNCLCSQMTGLLYRKSKRINKKSNETSKKL